MIARYMSISFSQRLKRLRHSANLTNKSLSELAGVPESLVSGVQAGSRRIGEKQARKIGSALGLCEAELEEFVLEAINTCTEKVLNAVVSYPAKLINFLPLLLQRIGISAFALSDCYITGDHTAPIMKLGLKDGGAIQLQTTIKIE